MPTATHIPPSHTVILFYKFFRIAQPGVFRDEHRAILESFGLKGRMLVATEGINATFEGSTEAVEAYMRYLKSDPRFASTVVKASPGTGEAFTKLSIRVRPEIVTLGAGEFDVEKETAPIITADDLERLYDSKEEFVVLDLRNDYETAVGAFEKTYDPKLEVFNELPSKMGGLEHLKNKKIVAVCTGGIRCEKATCLLKKEGFTNVVQLQDGIHAYMQKYPGRHFKGSLFVFDNRMATPVVDVPSREIIGKCIFCSTACEDFYSDDSVRPSRKVICCNACISSRRKELRSCNE